jgi:hypothetical protein
LSRLKRSKSIGLSAFYVLRRKGDSREGIGLVGFAQGRNRCDTSTDAVAPGDADTREVRVGDFGESCRRIAGLRAEDRCTLFSGPDSAWGGQRAPDLTGTGYGFQVGSVFGIGLRRSYRSRAAWKPSGLGKQLPLAVCFRFVVVRFASILSPKKNVLNLFLGQSVLTLGLRCAYDPEIFSC